VEAVEEFEGALVIVCRLKPAEALALRVDAGDAFTR